MKTLFLLIILLAGSMHSNCQENINYFPFCIESKWGICDNKKNEVIPPEAKRINFLEDRKNLIFLEDANGKNFFFNIDDGTKTETEGAMRSEIKIGKEDYYLMASSKGNYLYSLTTKKEFPQQLKYKFMYNQTLTDEKGKAYNYVIGYLENEKIIIMEGNSPQLKLALPETFERINYVALNDKDYGIVFKNGNTFSAYTPALVKKGSLAGDDEYFIYEDATIAKLKKIYGRDIDFISDIDFAEFRSVSKDLVTEEQGDRITLSRDEGGNKTTLAKIENYAHCKANFDRYKGIELFRLINENWEAYFAAVVNVVDGKKELMLPEKYIGL